MGRGIVFNEKQRQLLRNMLAMSLDSQAAIAAEIDVHRSALNAAVAENASRGLPAIAVDKLLSRVGLTMDWKLRLGEVHLFRLGQDIEPLVDVVNSTTAGRGTMLSLNQALSTNQNEAMEGIFVFDFGQLIIGVSRSLSFVGQGKIPKEIPEPQLLKPSCFNHVDPSPFSFRATPTYNKIEFPLTCAFTLREPVHMGEIKSLLLEARVCVTGEPSWEDVKQVAERIGVRPLDAMRAILELAKKCDQ